jgi:DNA repair protein RecO (recombination protein O)
VHSEKSDAIVIRTVPWSETSLIVTLLTRGFGKVSAIAKGARRLKSPFDGSLDLLSLCSVVFIDKSGDVLDVLTESKLIRRFRSASANLDALNCGYYLADVLNRITESDRELSDLFHLTDQTLTLLDQGLPPLSLTVRFEWQCLRMLGHAPQIEACVQCNAPMLPSSDSSSTAFSLLAGGVLCRNCLFNQRQVIRLKNEVLIYLWRINQSDWRSDEVVQLPTERRAEVRQIMNGLFAHLLDRPVRLASLLDSIKL